MFVATDKDGREYLYSERPSRGHTIWSQSNNLYVMVPKGTIERLLNYPLTWDDEAEEIVEYKDKDLKEDKVIKQNIKMRVTPEQSRKVQEICFANGIYWNPLPGKWDIRHTASKFLYIEDVITHSFSESLYSDDDFKEENDLFNEQELEEIDADLFIRTNGTCEENTTLNDNSISFKDEEYIKLEKKVFNLRKQLEKYVVKIANQKEEITRLLLQKEDLQNRLNISNKTVVMSIDNDIELIKLLEEKDAIIKYLESKLEI